MATNSTLKKKIIIEVDAGQATVSIDGMTSSLNEANTELLKLSENAGKGRGVSGATGGATATVLELGRTISDSNYGIRGMANNVSQLASNFLFMTRTVDETTKKAIGFGGALRQVGSTILGPLGILLAIQGVIALLEKFEINSMKAKSASNEFDSSLTEEITTLKIYDEALLDVNTSLEERVGIMKGLSRLDKDLADKLKEAGTDTQKLTKVTQDFLKEKELELEIGLKKLELDEIFDKKLDLRSKKEATEEEIRGMRNDEFITASGQRAQILNDLDDITQNLDDTTKEYNKTSEEYFLLLSKTTNEEKDNAKESKKVFKQKYLDLSKIILAFQREEEVTLEKSEVKKAEIQKRYQEEDLLRRRENFEEKERLRLEEFKRSNASDEEKLLAEQKSQESIFKAKMDYFRALLALEDKYNADVKMRDEERYRGYEQRLRESQDELTNVMLEGQIAEANHLIAHLELQRKLVDEKESQDLIRLEKEKQLAMEQANNLADEIYMTEEFQRKKTAIQRKYSNERTEIDKIEERQRLASVGAVGGLFSAMSGLAEKSSKEHKRLATAGALIDTYVGVNRALADPLLTTFGRFAAAATSLVQGLASVKAINSVSKSSASAGASSAGAVGGDRTFDFNLVGSTGTNQLAEAVGSQFQEPVQAYVVSSQMTSQQELDLQISTGASLGGD